MTTIKALLTTLLATVVALAVTLLVVLPASAHTAMLRASPDRDATAGGSITFVDLEFLDPVSEASVTVTYNGVPLAGRTAVPTGEVITFILDQPLTQPGRYQVSYEMVSFDNDFTIDGFFFTFDPAADQTARLESLESGGASQTTLILSGAGLVVVVGLLGLFVWRFDSRRREQSLDATDGYYNDNDYDYDDGYENDYDTEY